jgi:serine/threonine-protein kinase
MDFGIAYLLVLGVVGVVFLSYLPRSILRKILQTAALLLTGVVLAILFRQLFLAPHLPPLAWLVCFFLFFGLSFLFVRLLKLSFGPAYQAAGTTMCPPVRWLEDLLAERLSPEGQRRLTAHLENCKACQHRVERLTAGHKAWPGLAQRLSERPPSPEPALREVMDRLKGQPAAEATSDQPRFAGNLPLGFLSPPAKPEQLGRLERYEVLEEVGRGGMGIVLKAFDPSLHRVVAIKVLAPQLATSGVARKRFLREARAAAAVSHDHIVTIHAVDEANGLPYLVMQYIAGKSLQDRIDKEGPLDTAEVVRIGMQTASGLAAAHAHGIVHRDIKPANVLLEEGVPRVKITDFGLARAMDDASLTQSGCVAGSPLYMAPEQARGEALDHRADLFSLGSVLYTMCTGRPPFRAANTLAVLRRVSEDPPRPIRETNPEVPDWLAAVVEKLMAKDPPERYQSAAEVVEVLGQHLAQLQHCDWVPPARPPAPVGTAGLPTSVTICPSCGANLHVPERMVGSVVHCAECGKPFRVEEGSEVIQVARAVPPPFGPRARARRKLPRWAWIALPCAAVLLLVLWLFSVSAVQRERALAAESLEQARWAASRAHTPATAAVKRETAAPARPQGPAAEPFWKSALRVLPPEATVFGALNFEPLGPLTLDDSRTQTLLRLLVPGETVRRLTPENLGRIRIDSVGAAYYPGSRGEDGYGIAHLKGVALDGRRRSLDFIHQTTAEKVRVEENDQKGTLNPLIRVHGPELPFALGIFEDNDAFLARSLKQGAPAAQHLKALEQIHLFDFTNSLKHTGDVLSGYNPPWIKAALAEMPPDACGFFLGEIPGEWRKFLTDALKLRVCPRTFVLHLKRKGQQTTLSLAFSVDKAEEDVVLQKDLERWRLEGIDMLKERFPAVRNEQRSLALVGQALKTMRWVAGSSSVRTQVQIGDPTWQALGVVLKRAAP